MAIRRSSHYILLIVVWYAITSCGTTTNVPSTPTPFAETTSDPSSTVTLEIQPEASSTFNPDSSLENPPVSTTQSDPNEKSIIIPVDTDGSTACQATMAWSPLASTLVYVMPSQGIWELQLPNTMPRQLSEQGSQPVWSESGQLIVIGNMPEWEQPWTIEVFDEVDSAISPLRFQTDWYKQIYVSGWRDNTHLGLTAHLGSNADDLLVLDIETGTVTYVVSSNTSVISNAIGSAYYWSPLGNPVMVQRIPQRLTVLDVDAQAFTDLVPFDSQQYQKFEKWNPVGSQFMYEEWGTPEDPSNTPTPSLYLWDVNTNHAELMVPHGWGADWSTTYALAFYLLGNPQLNEQGEISDTDYVAGEPFDAYLVMLDVASRQPLEIIPLGPVANPNDFLNGTVVANDMGRCGLPRPLWSPDGSQLLYWDAEGATWLWDGERSLAVPQARYGAWSSDGTWLALRGETEIIIFCPNQERCA